MTDKLKIAIIADPFLPVPPSGYGGIERIISFLIKHLVDNGHEVILVAHQDSVVPITLIPFGNQNNALKHVNNLLIVNKIKKFRPDIIHSFGRLAYLLPFLRSQTPKIMSYQRKPTISQIRKAILIGKKGSLSFTGCSHYISNQIKPYADVTTIYNGFPVGIYEPNFNYNPEAPLIFLGRIEYIKGTHIAIEIAKKTNSNLIIAGNVPEFKNQYFEEQIEPFLSEKIKYLGVVNDLRKNELLQQAKALLMPVLWDEPFGIVMVEAMACGTPVIGLDRGGLSEIIKQGYSGFVCNTIPEMINCVRKINNLSRKCVWKYAMQNFSSIQITNTYEQLYLRKIRSQNNDLLS